MRSETCLATNGNLDCTKSLLQQKIHSIEAIADSLPIVIIILDIQTHAVEYMSPNGQQILGFSLEEIKELGSNYQHAFFNMEDVMDFQPKFLELMNKNNKKDYATFFQQVRPSPAHDWNWYLSTSKIIIRDADDNPTHYIVIAAPVDPLHHVTSKVNRLLEENNFLRRNQKIFALLTKREKEILKLMALGESAIEIACKLHISEETAATHRRNIKAKLKAENNYDIMKFAQAFDLI